MTTNKKLDIILNIVGAAILISGTLIFLRETHNWKLLLGLYLMIVGQSMQQATRFVQK